MKAPLLIGLIAISLSSCGDGCDENHRAAIWDEYRIDAQRETALARDGKITMDQLDARYYLCILSRDRRIAYCGFPKESPFSKDRQQIFASDIDPICILSLSGRYAELSGAQRSAMNGDSMHFSELMRNELQEAINLLSWYGRAVGIGDVQSYDAYANLDLIDTSLINTRVRELSRAFRAAREPAVQIELCP